MSGRPRLRAVVDAVAAIRTTDPARVEAAVQELGHQRRWLTWLAYAAGTIAVVFDGLVLLVRNWQLTLLQLVPAAWISAMTWNLRTHFLEDQEIPAEIMPVAAALVLVIGQVAYWCNATFAFTMLQGPDMSIRAAFRSAATRWRLVSGLALLTTGAQAAIWLLGPHLEVRRFGMALLAMFVVQVYMFIAVPSWLLHVRTGGTRRERLVQTLTTGVLAGVAAVPGFLLNRIGLLLVGVGVVGAVGIAIVAIGAVLHVTASSGVRVVKLSVRLRRSGGGRGDPGRGPAEDAGGDGRPGQEAATPAPATRSR